VDCINFRQMQLTCAITLPWHLSCSETIKLTLRKSEGLRPHINILYPLFITNPGVYDMNVHVCVL
jgi:hypothetical protein